MNKMITKKAGQVEKVWVWNGFGVSLVWFWCGYLSLVEVGMLFFFRVRERREYFYLTDVKQTMMNVYER